MSQRKGVPRAPRAEVNQRGGEPAGGEEVQEENAETQAVPDQDVGAPRAQVLEEQGDSHVARDGRDSRGYGQGGYAAMSPGTKRV